VTPEHALPSGYDAADALQDSIRREDLAELRVKPADEATKDESAKPSTNAYHRQVIQALRRFLDRQRLIPDAIGGWLDANSGRPVGCDGGKLVTRFLFEFRHQEGASASYVEETLTALVDEQRQQRRNQIIARITGRRAAPEGRDALASWVKAVTSSTAEQNPAVMAHWLWLVKRMALGLRTEHDLMPIIYGPQGSGKSTATERLCEPVAELVTTMNASHLTDERKFSALATFLIGRWEEMQGAQRSDLEALKHSITCRQVTFRRLGSHVNEVLWRTCSFIGTTNNPVDALVADSTGARRFYQLTTPARLDFEAINRIDPLVIWSAISEHDPPPIIPVLTVVRHAQADLVSRDAVTLWLAAECWGPLVIKFPDSYEDLAIPEYDAQHGEPFEHLCARYKHWCATVGSLPMSVVRIGHRLQQEGFVIVRPGRGNSRARRYFRPPVPPRQEGADSP
jgi:hypothetical protein